MKANNTISDERLNAIIDEEGGKFFVGQRKYGKALDKFKLAFAGYKNSGNVNASKRLLKFALLAGIITKEKNYANLDEVKKYKYQ